MSDAAQTIENALFERFGERFDVDPALPGLDELARLSARRVRRRYHRTAMSLPICCV